MEVVPEGCGMKGGIQVLFSPLSSFAVLCIFWLLHTAGRGLPAGGHWSGCPAQPPQAASGAGPGQGAVSASSGDSSAGEKPRGRHRASLSAGTVTLWPALSSRGDHCHPHHVHVEDVTLGTRFVLCEDRAVPLPCPHTQSGGRIAMVPPLCAPQGCGWGPQPAASPSRHGARLQEDVSLFSAFRKWFIGHNQ